MLKTNEENKMLIRKNQMSLIKEYNAETKEFTTVKKEVQVLIDTVYTIKNE